MAGWRSLAPRLALIAGTLGLSACPLPIARTEMTSAPVVGAVTWADGTPAANLDVAVSTEWSDDRCGKVAVRTMTSGSGEFRLEGTEKTYGTTWIIPNLDRLPPSWRLCIAVRDTMRRAYVGRGALYDAAPTDTLACVAWEWENDPRVSCLGQAERGVLTGGEWTDSTARTAGFYRVLMTIEPTILERYDRDKPQDVEHFYVQWVEPVPSTLLAASQPRYRVDTTVHLPLDQNRLRGVQDVQLWRREGRWLVSVHGFKSTFMNDFARAEVVFELGLPGQVTRIAGP